MQHAYLNTPSFESRFRSHLQRTILHSEDLRATSFFFFLISRHHNVHALPPHHYFSMASEAVLVQRLGQNIRRLPVSVDFVYTDLAAVDVGSEMV